MARAFCTYEFENVMPGADDTYILPMRVVFAGTDLPTTTKMDLQRIDVTLTFTDSWNVMEGKLVDAAVARAEALEYTVARNGILLTQMDKGT